MSSITDLLGRSLLHRLSSVAAISLSVAFITSSHAQSITTPCMENGSPCQVPGPAGIGNLILPLPFGITYNSMFAARSNPSGIRPSGFFGPGMTFPFGYIEMVGASIYRSAPDGTETGFSIIGNVYASENAPLGDLTSIACASSISCTETHPSGLSTRFVKQGQSSRFYPTEVKDQDGHSLFTLSYGTNGALFTITDPNGLSTLFKASQSKPNQVGEITDPRGDKALISYDDAGRISTFQYDGTTLNLAYNAIGNLTRLTQSRGGKTQSWKYSYGGGVLSDVFDSNNYSTAFIYTATTVTSVNGANGIPKEFQTTTYEASNFRPIGVKHEAGKGAPSSATTLIWRSTLTPAGLPATTTDALGGTTSYQYTSGPFPTTVSLPDGTVKSLTYDENNLYRPTQIVSTGPDQKVITEDLTWSGARLTARSVTSDSAVVLNENFSSTSSSQTVTRTTTNNYTYDSNQNLTGINGPGGRVDRTLSNGEN